MSDDVLVLVPTQLQEVPVDKLGGRFVRVVALVIRKARLEGGGEQLGFEKIDLVEDCSISYK